MVHPVSTEIEYDEQIFFLNVDIFLVYEQKIKILELEKIIMEKVFS